MASLYVPYEGPIVTRAEAKAGGLTRFFTGGPCGKRDHISQRIVSNGRCVACYYLMRVYYPVSEASKLTNKLRLRAQGEKRRAYKRAYYARHNAKIKAQTEAGRKRNPEPQRAIVRNRRAQKRAASGTHTATEIADILRLQKGRCAYCRKSIRKGYDVDHITPLSKSGANDRRNLQLTCEKCNGSKGARDPVAHAQRIGLLI